MDAGLIIVIVVIAVVGAGGFWLWRRRSAAAPVMETIAERAPVNVRAAVVSPAPEHSDAPAISTEENMAVLEIVQGPEALLHGKNVGTSIPLNRNKISIGRNARQVDIQLYSLEEPSSVSRLHCTIEFYPTIQCFMITDEGSSSGTKVDGLPVTAYQPHSLRDGDLIELGLADRQGAAIRFHTRFNPPDSGGRLRVDQGIQAKETLRQSIDQLVGVARATTPLKCDVFISYSRKDRDTMRAVRDALTQGRLVVWSDENLEPGSQDWRSDVQFAIENARCVVAILSPDAKNSEWVNEELNYAKIRRAPIFTLLARGDESNAVPFGVSGVQWIDMRADYDEALQDIVYEKALDQLVTSINEYLGR